MIHCQWTINHRYLSMGSGDLELIYEYKRIDTRECGVVSGDATGDGGEKWSGAKA
jgi:hypothetical protein